MIFLQIDYLNTTMNLQIDYLDTTMGSVLKWVNNTEAKFIQMGLLSAKFLSF